MILFVDIALLETQPPVESLCQWILKLEFWVVSKNINERLAALQTYEYLTKRFDSFIADSDKEIAKHKQRSQQIRNEIPKVGAFSLKLESVRNAISVIMKSSTN
eukprot:446850_1